MAQMMQFYQYGGMPAAMPYRVHYGSGPLMVNPQFGQQIPLQPQVIWRKLQYNNKLNSHANELFDF